ncbi:hypothetical protein R6Q59_015426 [Mikania micrantha]
MEVDGLDRFDQLSDSLLLLIFTNIGDLKALCRCFVVSSIFHILVPQVIVVPQCPPCKNWIMASSDNNEELLEVVVYTGGKWYEEPGPIEDTRNA